MIDKRFVVTINHQLGSGGAYLGQKLSDLLGIPFIDREILKKVAKQLNQTEAELEHREERLSSFWGSFSRIASLMDPAQSMVADNYIPTDRELFQFESDTIRRIAEKSSGIFLGRCGGFILRDHPCHVSVLVHAEKPYRIKRLCNLYHLSTTEAEKLVDGNDRERNAYIHTFTRQNWLDARLYDLCVNTSKVGFDKTVELVISCIEARIGLIP